jgi:hypothetical protein
MAVEKWIAGTGAGLTWTDAGATSINIASTGLVNGNAILSNVSVTNGTALDIFADLNIQLASAAFIAPNFIGIYLFPLSQDGSTYGDGRFGTTAAGPPASNYSVGSIVIPAVTAAQQGTLSRIVLPPGTFKFVFYNQTGVAWATSANSVWYRTYNRVIV